MKYGKVLPGVFRARPNRFIAHVEICGELCACHVKNTGRCRELLVPGAKVYVEESPNPARKTKYDLIAVEKPTEAGPLLINMDSQAPNKAAAEAIPRLLPGLTYLRPETVFGNSRFDFYAETLGADGFPEKWFIEVKGVTLEENGAARFPDAPTERGAKHLRELCRCVDEGYRAAVLFLIQMKGVRFFEPNEATDPDFAAALRQAAAHGVCVFALDCLVTPDSMTTDQPVEVKLGIGKFSLALRRESSALSTKNRDSCLTAT